MERRSKRHDDEAKLRFYLYIRTLSWFDKSQVRLKAETSGVVRDVAGVNDMPCVCHVFFGTTSRFSFKLLLWSHSVRATTFWLFYPNLNFHGLMSPFGPSQHNSIRQTRPIGVDLTMSMLQLGGRLTRIYRTAVMPPLLQSGVA